MHVDRKDKCLRVIVDCSNTKVFLPPPAEFNKNKAWELLKDSTVCVSLLPIHQSVPSSELYLSHLAFVPWEEKVIPFQE